MTFRISNVFLLLALASDATAEGLQQYEREADKWSILQEVLRTTPFKPALGSDPPYCQQILADLKVGANVEVIEPDVRADSPNDPKLKRWKQCDKKDWGDAGIPIEAYPGLTALGGPPYRYYKIDVDGNRENGLEDVLYHELGTGPSAIGSTGYTWVDNDECLLKGSVDLSFAQSYSTPPSGRFTLDVLVRYQGEPVVLELVWLYPKVKRDEGSSALGYRLKAEKFVSEQPRVCAWH